VELLVATGRVAEIVGVDLDETALTQARARWPQGTFLCADAARLGEAYHRRFDLVLIRQPDLLAQPAHWRAVFAAVPIYLRPGGRVVVVLLGGVEESLARRWLEEDGLRVARADASEGGARRVLVAEPGTGPLVWEEGDVGGVCDVRTGACAPAGREVQG